MITLDLLGQKILYANCGDQFYKYDVVSNCVVRIEELRLYNYQQEANSLLLFSRTIFR